MQLTKLNKERQLKELSHIVTGIRLFNRDGGKGGQGIDDCENHHYFSVLVYNDKWLCIVPTILHEAIPATIQSIENELKETTELVYKYTGSH
jgi:hypothetical protein